jgi:hypothetical protein
MPLSPSGPERAWAVPDPVVRQGGRLSPFECLWLGQSGGTLRFCLYDHYSTVTTPLASTSNTTQPPPPSGRFSEGCRPPDYIGLQPTVDDKAERQEVNPTLVEKSRATLKAANLPGKAATCHLQHSVLQLLPPNLLLRLCGAHRHRGCIIQRAWSDCCCSLLQLFSKL